MGKSDKDAPQPLAVRLFAFDSQGNEAENLLFLNVIAHGTDAGVAVRGSSYTLFLFFWG